jgi:N-acetylneuraminate synthase/N,N'-diacetyllegionaminate synthase
LLKIRDKEIGPDKPVFIIAEAGVNHNGDVGLAKRLIDVAAEAGADAVKFQTFKANKLISARAPHGDYKSTGVDLKLIEKLELSLQHYIELIDYCQDAGIVFLATPFDFGSVNLLERLSAPAFKVSSGDLTNIPLLKHVGSKNLPVLLSTGMGNLSEIEQALQAISSVMELPINHLPVVLMHCVSHYPAPMNEINLKAIKTLSETFKLPVGYSDHTKGVEAAMAAVVMGACVIEKHYTLNRNFPGPDHKSSIAPEELNFLVESIRNIETALGDGIKQPAKCELSSIPISRKSLVSSCKISAGQAITKEMLDIKRPGTGIEPRYYDLIQGKKSIVDIPEDEVLSWDMFLGQD